MWLIHHVSENMILDQWCSLKYNNNENNNPGIVIENGIIINNEGRNGGSTVSTLSVTPNIICMFHI